MPNKFSREVIEQVWERAHIIHGLDKNIYRADNCGAIICKNMYGKTREKLSMGWVIGKIRPSSLGGADGLLNYQPLQWENFLHKAENYPSWTCSVKAGEKSNCYIQYAPGNIQG